MSDKVKNRKWVTKAIIIFVAGLLVLTFFSNTTYKKNAQNCTD